MPDQGRIHFQEELDKLEEAALGGLDLVVGAVDRALETVKHQDVELASMVIADDDRIDGRYLEVHQGILSLLALQAPVAGDLRVVAALLHLIKHVERMGDQCVNIAKLVPLAGHDPPTDPELLDELVEMGGLARSLVVQCKQAFAARDVGLAEDLVRQDDRIDRLNREIFTRALDFGTDPDRREWSMHMMLIGRAIERIGDNAVDIGEQTAFVVTGLFREFEDASHPGASAERLMPLRLLQGAPDPRALYGLFHDAGANVAVATSTLSELLEGWPEDPEGLRHKLVDLEHEGDRLTHDIYHRLLSEAHVPVDHSDALGLASELDDVVDLSEEVGDFLALYRIEAPMDQAVQLAGVLAQAGAEIGTALSKLARPDELKPHLVELERLEDVGDRGVREALACLFDGGVDPMVVIRWKDLFERLEQAIDACEHVAHVLEGIVLKET